MSQPLPQRLEETSIHILKDVRVLDCTSFVSGPLTSQVLADLGADVVHIERTEGGDAGRVLPPFIEGQGHWFVEFNRNKRSLTLNFKHPKGRDILNRLVENADVMVENNRPGVMRTFGLDYQSLRSVNPQLIYCSISGFGEKNSRSGQPAFDPVLQAYTGIMMTTGFEGTPPARVAPSIVDRTAGWWAATGILAALYERQRTGRGRRIHVSLLGAAIEIVAAEIYRYLATGKLTERSGSAGATGGPSQAFLTSDGKYIHVAAGDNRLWQRFCMAVERPDLIEHPDYRNPADRIQNRVALSELLESVFSTKPLAYWEPRLIAHLIPSAPVRTVADLVADKEIMDEFLSWATLPNGGKVPAVKSPLDFDDARVAQWIRRPPPSLGEHNEDILRNELGYDDDAIAALREEGVIT